MENISNDKIEKARADLAKFKSELVKSKARTVELQAKIREQEKQLEIFEALEIAARYRDLIGNEDFAAQRKQNQAAAPIIPAAAQVKEAEFNEANEN
jgi:multidrug resistance efflux pump